MGKTDRKECLTEYERIRNERIELNKTRLQEFGIKEIAKSMSSLVESSKSGKRKGKEKVGNTKQRDVEYFPNLPTDSDEEDDVANFEVPRKVTRSCGQHHVQYIPPRSLRRYSNNTKQGVIMNNHDHSGMIQERTQLGKSFTKDHEIVQGPSLRQTQNAKKTTMADFILNKKQLDRGKVVNKHVDISTRSQPIGADVSARSQVVEEHREPHQSDQYKISRSMENDGHISYPSEDDRSVDSDNVKLTGFTEDEATEDDNEEINLNNQDFELEAILEDNIRGPTMLHHVHMRPLDKRKAIILNEFGQPIGPIINGENTVGELSRFLGTMARDNSYAPLVLDSWRKVPNKDKMWDYVQMKYIIPDEGKNWVMKTIASAWRTHKSRFKKQHYYKYTDDKTRWQHRSKTIPDEDFLKLLAKWKKKSEKLRCSRNKDRRMS